MADGNSTCPMLSPRRYRRHLQPTLDLPISAWEIEDGPYMFRSRLPEIRAEPPPTAQTLGIAMPDVIVSELMVPRELLVPHCRWQLGSAPGEASCSTTRGGRTRSACRSSRSPSP
jgi:hypothetical protein